MQSISWTKPNDVVLGRNNFRIVAEGAMLQVFLPHGLKTRRANEGPSEDLKIISALRRFAADPLQTVRMERCTAGIAATSKGPLVVVPPTPTFAKIVLDVVKAAHLGAREGK